MTQIYDMTECATSRLNGSVCSDINLNVQFSQCGINKDPYALKSIKIYYCSVGQANLVTEIVLPCATDEDRDLSNEFIYGGLIRRCGNTVEPGLCGTDYQPIFTPGCFIFALNLCPDLFKAGVYYDVWEFVGDPCDPCFDETEITNPNPTYHCEIDDLKPVYSKCSKFYVSDQCWNMDDGLRKINLGFEPLESRFQQPEIRTLEIGLMPLPLYDYDVKKMAAIIPSLDAVITFMTAYQEIIIDREKVCIGLRQGSYRSNPYVLQYLLDTNKFLKGTYKYRIDVRLPNGETRSSPYFNVAIR